MSPLSPPPPDPLSALRRQAWARGHLLLIPGPEPGSYALVGGSGMVAMGDLAELEAFLSAEPITKPLSPNLP